MFAILSVFTIAGSFVFDAFGINLAAVQLAGGLVVLLRWGTPLLEKLGPSGIGTLIRIMGFFMLCISVEMLVVGVKHFLHL